MSTIAEFSIPPDALPGGDLLAEMPNTVVELERIIPTEENALPFFWVWSDDVSTFMDSARNDDEIEDITVLDEVEYGALVRATWTPEADLIHAIKALQATILEARATAEEWTFRIRAERQEGIATFRDVFSAHDIPVTLNRLYDLSELVDDDRNVVTDEQRETLLAAYEKGYYERPREVDQQELGRQFDITSRAVSDRLRRGTASLVEEVLLTAKPSVDG